MTTNLLTGTNIMKLNLNSKLLLFILSTTAFIYILSLGYIGLRNKNESLSTAKKLTDTYVMKYSHQVETFLQSEFKASRTLSEVFEDEYNNQDSIFDKSESVIKHIFQKRSNYQALWMSWERFAIDENWDKPYGRVRINYHNSFGKLIEQIDTLNTFGDDVNSLYYGIKTNKVPVITDPYYDTFDGERKMVASIAYPTLSQGRFVGLAGIDFTLDRFQNLIKDIKPFGNSTAFLISNDGVFVANQDENLLGESADKLFNGGVDKAELLDKVKSGKGFSIEYTSDGVDYYVSFAPVTMGSSSDTWMAGIKVSKDEINEKSYAALLVSFLVGFIGLIILTVVIVIIAKTITKPLTKVTDELQLLSEGNIGKAEYLKINTNDEVAEIADSTNKLIKSLHDTSRFAMEIGNGNLDAEYEALGENDKLGKALLDMRSSLQKARKEEEKRREEEERQKWATSGFAKFGDILRHNTEDMKAFADNIISNLVEYTSSNQGALYLINKEDENDAYIEMMSCYAYERKKYVDKRLEIGEGLVGQCVLERKPIFMTDIPENYISITSGLGGSNPRSLLIVPLTFNEEVYGVLELASFNVYEDYQRKFVEELSENIASTVSSVKVNIRTKKLLEESKLKSEELAAQEEEMRQNMEELQTTQEESARREHEMNGILNALNESYLVGEMDINGDFLAINNEALHTFGITKETAIGSNIRNFINEDEISDFNALWDEVMSGKTFKQKKEIVRNGKKFKITETYSPIFDENEEIFKVLNIAVII